MTGVSRPAERHFAAKVRQGTVAKAINTVILPDVPVAAEIAAINAGSVPPGRTAGGERTYMVGGRTYGVHANGRLYPISGDGFVELDRGSFKALGVYNTLGPSRQAETILDNMKIPVEGRARALEVWAAVQKGLAR